MRSLIRLLITRRLVRFMPGGWVVFVLASPITWRLVRRAYAAIRARQKARGAPPPPPPG